MITAKYFRETLRKVHPQLMAIITNVSAILCPVLVTVLRPYVHFHQFNWLYTVYGFKRDYLWYMAMLNASLQCLDTLFLFFDYFNLLISELQEVRIRPHLPLLDPDTFRPNGRPVFPKMRRYDSDTEILYLK